uniref:Putative secreted protein n=1 Tax=Anopheles darlingi TaxID=43151 RepID=A0A2M4D550_ANODA
MACGGQWWWWWCCAASSVQRPMISSAMKITFNSIVRPGVYDLSSGASDQASTQAFARLTVSRRNSEQRIAATLRNRSGTESEFAKLRIVVLITANPAC